MKKLEMILSLPFFGFQNFIFRFLLGGGQNCLRLRVIRGEAEEAIMHLKAIYGAYGNWLGLTP